MQKHYVEYLCVGVNRTRRIGDVEYQGDEISRATTHELREDNDVLARIGEKLDDYFGAFTDTFVEGYNYANSFNSWLHSINYNVYENNTKRERLPADGVLCDRWRIKHRLEWRTKTGRTIRAVGTGFSQFRIMSNNMAIYNLIHDLKKETNMLTRRLMYLERKETYTSQLYDQKCEPVEFQNEVKEKDNVQGDATQESDRQTTTIVTRDQGVTESIVQPIPHERNLLLSSSEMFHTFDSIIGRWMPLDSIKLSTADTSLKIKQYKLPSDLYITVRCSPNLLPFDTFIYSHLQVKMKFVVNANKFHVGRVLASVKNDPYGSEDEYTNLNAMLCRPHVMLDLSSNNEGILTVPFRFHRTMMRNKKSGGASEAVKSAYFATVDLRYISKLKTGADGIQSMDIRPYFMFEKAKFAGLSYRVDTQMDNPNLAICSSIGGAEKRVHCVRNSRIVPLYNVNFQMDTIIEGVTNAVIGSAEGLLHQYVRSKNQDKPTDMRNVIITPRAKPFFPNGRGVDNATSMQLDPFALTTFADCQDPYDPRTTLDIARIWGVLGEFNWNQNQLAGTELANIHIDPVSRNYTEDIDTVPTPLEITAGMYTYWSGTIEVRIDFISNSFHTGAVLLSAEFSRPSTNLCQGSSCYTKTFHLGEQKSVSFVVPYIYDTPYRRSTAPPFDPIIVQAPTTNSTVGPAGSGLRPEVKTFLKVRVVNELRPVSSAPQVIECKIFWRAGKDFSFHGLKQSCWVPKAKQGDSVVNFPLDQTPKTVVSGFIKWPLFPPITERERKEFIPRGEVNGILYNAKTRTVVGESSSSEEEGDSSERRKTRPTPRPQSGQSEGARGKREVNFQMDTGEKENFDETDNFASGISRISICSADDQTRIKDIIRKPVYFGTISITADNVPGKSGKVFMFPNRPPNKDFGIPKWDGAAKKFVPSLVQPLLQQNPQVVLLNMHRYWRGTNRFTYVVKTVHNYPIYVTYIPHSGISPMGVLIDVQTANSSLGVGRLFPHMSGLTTDMIIPKINPVHTIQFPYESENNWTLMFQDATSTDLSWRDRGDYNAGVFTIYSAEPLEMDLWWQAGDDFELANFYGPYAAVNRSWAYTLSDNKVVTQMDSDEYYSANEEDFPESDSITMVSRVREYLPTQRNLVTAVCAAIPYVGPGIALSRGVMALEDGVSSVKELTHCGVDFLSTAKQDIHNMNKRVTAMIQSMEVTNAVYQDLGHQAVESVQTLTSEGVGFLATLRGILTTIMEKINGLFCGLFSTPTWIETTFNFVVDLVLGWMESSWLVVVVATFKVLCRILGHAFCDSIFGFCKTIAGCMGVVTQADTDREKTITGAILGILGVIFGIACDPFKTVTMMKYKLWELFTPTKGHGVSFLNQVILYVNNVYTTLKTVILEFFGYVTPEAQALQKLSGQGSVINSFIIDAQQIMSEANASLLISETFRIRVWRTVMQAYQLQRLLHEVPPQHATYALHRLCCDVIKFGNEKFLDMASCPVRYEPFVVCMEGKPGIGKSYLTDQLLSDLLGAIDFDKPTSGVSYVRVPGSRYWSGYRDQPAIVYDDWLNMSTSEQLTQQISELYHLKSTAVFIPEMAHLEEKKIKANPILVVLNCNDAFPVNLVDNVAPHVDAVLRRRDIVIRAELRDPFLTTPLREMTAEQSRNYEHLWFYIYESAVDGNAASDKLSYAQLKEVLVTKFVNYHVQEKVNVKRRLDLVLKKMNNPEISELNIQDPFELFYSTNNELAIDPRLNTTAWMPSEQLALEIESINRIIDQHQKIVPQMFSCTTMTKAALIGGGVSFVLRWVISKFIEIPLGTVDDVHTDELWPKMVFEKFSRRCYTCKKTVDLNRVCDKSFKKGDDIHYLCDGCNNHTWGRSVCQHCDGVVNIMISEDMMTNYASFLWRFRHCNKLEYLKQVFSILVVRGHMNRFMDFVLFMNSMMRGDIIGAMAVGTLRYMEDQVSDCHSIKSTHNGVRDNVLGEKIYKGTPLVSFQNDVPRIMAYEKYVNKLLVRQDNTIHEFKGPRCYHKDLSDYPGMVRFIDGKWWIASMDHKGGISIPDGLCCVSCYWRDTDVRIKFLEEYSELREKVISEHILMFMNDKLTIENLRQSVSGFLLPEWIVNRKEYIGDLTHSDWWTYLSEKWNSVRNLCIWLSGIGIIGSVLYKLFNVGAYFQSSSNGDTRKHSPIKRNFSAGKREHSFQGELYHRPIEDVIIDKIVNNFFIFDVGCDGVLKQRLVGLGIFGQYAIMPKHYLLGMKNAKLSGWQIHGYPLHSKQMRHEYAFDERDFSVIETDDLCLWKMPASFPMFKDIRRYFVKNSDLEGELSSDAVLVCVPTRDSNFPMLVEVELHGIEERLEVTGKDLNGEPYLSIARDVFCYNFSKNGACSSPLLLRNTQRPIAAIHFAGVAGGNGEVELNGFGVPVTQEVLGKFMEYPGAVEQVDYPTVEQSAIVFDEHVQVVQYGGIPRELVSHSNFKTRLRKSRIFEVNGLVNRSFPTILGKHDKRYLHAKTPLIDGSEKHGVLTADFPSGVVEDAAEYYWDGYLSNMPCAIANPERLTPEQAATGIPDYEYYDSVELKTSAGFPWCATSKTTKEHYVEFERNEKQQPVSAKIAPVLYKVLKEKEEMRRSGLIPPTIFVDVLKDERKNEEKIQKLGATRVFCMAPQDYVIACRQNMLHFTAAFMKNRKYLMNSLGINARGLEWSRLANELYNMNPRGVWTIDYSNFGPGFNAGVAHAAMTLMKRWIVKHVKNINIVELDCLLWECVQSMHVCNDLLYRQTCGSPSGGPFTSIINSLVNILLIMIAWTQLMGSLMLQEGISILEGFKKYVVFTSYGDDGIGATAVKYINQFNALTISTFFGKYGIVATDASKMESIKPYGTLYEASFLKSGFKLHGVHRVPIHGRIWVAPMEWRVIEDIPQWIHQCHNDKEATTINATTALLFAHAYGPHVFAEFKNKVNGALLMKKCKTVVLTWEEIDKLFFPTMYGLPEMENPLMKLVQFN